MSDELDISAGGAVSVDTDTLRDAARGFEHVGAELDDVTRLLGLAADDLDVGPVTSQRLAHEVRALRARARERRDAAAAVARALREAAATYETVELWAQRRAAELTGSAERVAAIDRRLHALHRDHPDARFAALMGMLRHTLTWPSDLVGQAHASGALLSPVGAAGLFVAGVAHSIRGGGFGRRDAAARLVGPASPVVVRRSATAATPAAAPRSFADLAARVPSGPTQVRVEKYSFAAAPPQYVVYVAGTRSPGFGGSEPFDNRSNLQLYGGRRSASVDATLAAMRDAGVRPGDIVHTAAHSQAAMVTSQFALEGTYDTRTLITFGSPVHADVGEGTLAVTVRHTDDPVGALAGGGHAQAVGAPGSFVVERSADPAPGPGDLAVPAHHMSAYVETAHLVDASDDPRVDAVRGVVDELAGAESIEVFEYTTVRRGENGGGGR